LKLAVADTTTIRRTTTDPPPRSQAKPNQKEEELGIFHLEFFRVYSSHFNVTRITN
jgi:hypothetical protein